MEKYRLLNIVRIVAMIGCIIGGLIFISGFFATGYNENHFLTFLGIGVAFMSMLVFGVGLFFTITDELVSKSKRGSRVKL